MSKPLPPQTIGDYTIGPEIGKGSFANVYKGYNRVSSSTFSKFLTYQKTNQPVAVKSVFRAKLDNKKLLENLEIEISILRTLQHPHIVALLDYKKTPDHFHLFMDYCSLGDLSYFIRKRDQLVKTHPIVCSVLQRYPSPPGSHGLNQVIVTNFLQQLASSLQFLRNQNLVHRDIKPQNLLLAPPLDEATFAKKHCVGMYELPILKIADFGFARFLPATSMAETLCGSPLYMAPEILRYEKYGAKADLWSVGAVLYEMSVGKPPFRAANHVELLAKIEKNRDRVTFPQSSDVPDEMALLIRGLLKCSPTERMGFSEFFNNELVTRNLKSTQPLVDQPNQDLFISEYLPADQVEPAKDLIASPLATKQLSRNNIVVEKDYVVVEKAAVEVNSLADEVTKTAARKPAMRRFSSDNNSRRPSFPERRVSMNRENPLTKALGAASNRLFGETPNISDHSTASAIEKLSTKAHSIAVFAEVKYKQVAPLSSDSAETLSGSVSNILCEEGVALYLKALSLFSRSMRLAHEWWNVAAGDFPEPKMLDTVEWIRIQFNECLEKAEFLKSKLLEISQPSNPAIAEKLIFDRALEISRNAALMELRREDLPNCEASYSTAIWMLEALLDVDKNDSEERLDKEDILMVEKFIMSIGKRLNVLRGRMDKKSIG